jgi:hypothetical protein
MATCGYIARDWEHPAASLIVRRTFGSLAGSFFIYPLIALVWAGSVQWYFSVAAASGVVLFFNVLRWLNRYELDGNVLRYHTLFGTRVQRLFVVGAEARLKSSRFLWATEEYIEIVSQGESISVPITPTKRGAYWYEPKQVVGLLRLFEFRGGSVEIDAWRRLEALVPASFQPCNSAPRQ